MLSPHTIWLFMIASLVLLLIPGPAVLYVITRSIDQGRKAGLASVIGIELGNLLLALGTAAGLSAIILSSDVLFAIVKYLGAAYLVYLGIKRFISKDKHSPITVDRLRTSKIFTQGIVIGVFNPKTALFFLAFLPQFVDVSHGMVWEQTLLLGLTFVVLGMITDSLYALLAGTVGSSLNRRGGLQKVQRYLSGGIYFALGAYAAVAGHGKN